MHLSLTEILTAGQRAAALTKQLLAFSRRQVLTLQIFDLNEALVSITSMIERLIGEDITLVRDLHHQPCIITIHADRGQIDQVVLNVAVNAKDAMPEGGAPDDRHADHRHPGQSCAPLRLTPRSLCAPDDPRFRAGHGPGHPVTHFRTLLYDQGRR
ncbi:MAG: Sensory box histidine kinase/response regulator [Nitrospira sp.]|nr:MAG: Sensory box histidine kinase/response regulator [Nitrospira sp.]